MRTDRDVQAAVQAELQWDPSIRDEDIAVSVRGGVVTIAGTVDSYAQRYSAERAVMRVKGARAVANELTVKLPNGLERSDSELAHAAVDALRWTVQVPADKVQIKVANGRILLKGEVDYYFQREAAEKAIRNLIGVKGVTNMITLKFRPAPGDIKRRIRDTLTRHAALDADQVTVELQGNRVVLGGAVRSVAEFRDAERAAWNAPGVAAVENLLRVAPLMEVGV